ncbi:hypothetical protein L209DRAFT_745192 [Thermothelomyces heterothallicus CBS 203.75]
MPMHNGFLPREGFKGDTVLQIIGNTALNPELVLPLVLLAKYTKKGEDWAMLHPVAYSRLKKLLAFGVLRRINGWFSRKVLDNWVDDRYDWSKEIVVVTGGSGGIGGQIVQLLAERRIKPTVLVNNAGVVQGRTVLEASERDVRSTFDVNTPAHYRTTKEFLPAMVRANQRDGGDGGVGGRLGDDAQHGRLRGRPVPSRGWHRRSGSEHRPD